MTYFTVAIDRRHSWYETIARKKAKLLFSPGVVGEGDLLFGPETLYWYGTSKGSSTMPGYDYVQSVLRALDILELVGNASDADGVALRYVANTLNLHKKTAHNLLRTLVHRKFLEKTLSPPRYRLGPVMGILRERQVRWMRNFLLPAIPRTIKISQRMRARVMVSRYAAGEIVGRFAVYAEQSEMPTLLYTSPMVAYGNAVIFQAFMEEPDLREYHARHPLGGGSLAYWKSFELLDHFLARVRAEGHLAFVKGDMFRVAAPIFNGDTTAIAMISLTKPFREMQSGEAQECIDLVCRAADELSSTCGKM